MIGTAGHVETIEGTTIHPVWSLDRKDRLPLAELEEGEQLCSLGSSLQTSDFELQTSTVLSSTLGRANTAVYNIEVHGEHVYQVGELGVLVHNAAPARCAMIAEYGEAAMKGWQAAHIIPKTGWGWAPDKLRTIIKRVTDKGLIDDMANLFASTPGHAGTHTTKYVNDVIKVMGNRHSKEAIIDGINILWGRIKAGRY